MDQRSCSPDSIYLFFAVFERKFRIEADFFPVMQELAKIAGINGPTADYTGGY
jgi:hypothetical protein